MTDVNEQFAAERRQQITDAYDAREAAAQSAAQEQAAWDQRIADGKLVPAGNGQFRVNDPGSWDDGEVWTQRQAQPGEVALVLPEHGLDERADGSVALYTAVPAWHELGQVIPGGTSDVGDVLKLGGLDWDTQLKQVYYRTHKQWLKVPGSHVTVRSDTDAPLGIVGSKYTPLANADAFAFLQELVDKHDVVWESAGSVRGGRKVFLSLRLPETVRIDAEGINDEIVPFIVAINTHDGSQPLQVVATPWRPVCANTERFAVRDAYTRWAIRHTAGAPARVDEARRALGLTTRYYERLAAEETQLAQTEMLIQQVNEVFAELWPLEDEPTKRQVTIAEKRTQTLQELWGMESARVGRTAYAAERAVTDYLDHHTPRKATADRLAAARATALVEGTDDELKSRAHRRLMQLATR